MLRKEPLIDPGWELALRVGESAGFQKSPRLREFLLYICENSLRNRTEELREQRIGEVVFSRGPDFRPNEDNIVRVEAARLRKRLAEYFASIGTEETVVITIPKGGYIAQFEPRSAVEQVAATSEIVEDAPAPIEHRAPQPAESGSWRNKAALAAVFLGAAAVLFSVYLLVRHTAMVPVQPGAQQASSRGPLWPELFNKQRSSYIICADTSLIIFQELTKVPITLHEYLDHTYWSKTPALPPEIMDSLRYLMKCHFTGTYDLRVSQEILHLNREYTDRSLVQSPRDVDVDSFKNANFVLLGARKANPWVELFEPALNFQFVFDLKARRSGYRNVLPETGEEPFYWIESDVPRQTAAYSLIAFLPNLRHDGNVLLIGGTNGEATEAAGMLVMRPALLDQMLRKIRAVEDSKVRHFEVLLKSKLSNGISNNPEVVAYRLLRTGA